MTSWLQILFLDVLQGITEFIPISSSGHLVLARHILGVEAPGLVLELTLHAGSLLSIIFFFRRRLSDLWRSFWTAGGEGRRYAAVIVLGTLPAGVIGLLFNETLARKFENPRSTAVFLCLTGIILISSRIKPPALIRPLTLPKGVAIGFAQALAILPGISRSGATITAGRRMGLSAAAAAEFSFVLSIPVLMGTSLLMLRDIGAAREAGWTLPMLATGMLLSAAVGYAALGVLLRVLRSGGFWLFGIYCLAAGIFGLALFAA